MSGCLLADFGADVIKVEHPRGEVARHAPPHLPGTQPPVGFMQATVNRNKRSLSLDLSSPRGADLFRRLVATSDVVIEITWPGDMDADVDLWVKAPDDIPVGYSNKGGAIFNLLRDDLGKTLDLSSINHESAYSRGVAAG